MPSHRKRNRRIVGCNLGARDIQAGEVVACTMAALGRTILVSVVHLSGSDVPHDHVLISCGDRSVVIATYKYPGRATVTEVSEGIGSY
jgi:hypothetical protein